MFSLGLTFVNAQNKQKNKKQLEPISDKTLERAVIYEANIRQYSAEGTFDAFAKDIPKLKEMGVKRIDLVYGFGEQLQSERFKMIELFGKQVIPLVRELLKEDESVE